MWNATATVRAYRQAQRRLVHTIRYTKQPQLFLHELSPSKTIVSFSEDPNGLHIGELQRPLTELATSDITPKTFIENKAFYSTLHDTFAQKAHLDQTYIIDALNYPNSFMALGDYKNILDYMNQRPEMPNTVGFVHVGMDSIIDPNSYEPNEMYTLCNIDGVITLSEFMLEELRKNL